MFTIVLTPYWREFQGQEIACSFCNEEARNSWLRQFWDDFRFVEKRWHINQKLEELEIGVIDLSGKEYSYISPSTAMFEIEDWFIETVLFSPKAGKRRFLIK